MPVVSNNQGAASPAARLGPDLRLAPAALLSWVAVAWAVAAPLVAVIAGALTAARRRSSQRSHRH